MLGVDLNTFDFHYDLTFCTLLMNADGTIYHTYGGRDWTDPQSHLSMEAFVKVLNDTLGDHAAYQKDPKPPKRRPASVIEDIPHWKQRSKKPECFHCHMVYEGRIRDAMKAKRFKKDDRWMWPDPIQAGLSLHRDDQTLVRAVEDGSSTANAGLVAGDRITTMNGAVVRTFGDVQRVLHEAPAKSTSLEITWTNGHASKTATLRLGKGWKEMTPKTYAWRAAKWPQSPKPGFGGRALNPDQKRQLGIPADEFAFRIGYLVTWGDNAYTGRNAAQAGLRKGDVVVSVAGKKDFDSEQHFQAWFRLTQKIGTKVDVVRIRNGKRDTVALKVIE